MSVSLRQAREFGGLVRLFKPEIQDAGHGENRNGQKRSGNSAELAARKHAEHDEQRMKLHTFAEQVRGEHIILKQTIDTQENQDEKQMRITAESGDQKNGDGGGERADHGNEFK